MESFDIIMSRNNTTTTAVSQRTRSSSFKCSFEEQINGSTAEITTRRPSAYRTKVLLTTTLTLVLCLCLLSTACASPVHKRRAIASGSDSTPSPSKVCHKNTPCGWAIYIPFTRRIDYFMKNTCDCAPNLACLKTDDDLSVNAYVYRCKTKPLTTTAETPTTT
ncbi:uncharacterized protein LOC126907228 [Daktulosphaira vitifoliae]|uniref:uncharacterized protein LOC126907228 n=1 Tax=Daktulosphaira vitifoliae TaxID=58002 RepID=UPI0021A9A68F|nr:uncharacterized protein LOC126907228 [Daktulosphaira vitifoliae]